MRRAFLGTALAGLAVSVLGVGLANYIPAFGTTLDGFSINTQDKAVTVTLFTDQRATYTTETQGKQFSIILPNAQLSEAQLNNGLPVVIDNKNRFIGRAVPMGDGNVKIILPNLPASEYAVSIQQRRPGQAMALAPVATVKPRAPLTTPADTAFEQIATHFPKPAPVKAAPVEKSITLSKPVDAPVIHSNDAGSAPIRLSALPMRSGGGGPIITNPYVIKPTSVDGPTTYSRYRAYVSPRSTVHAVPSVADASVSTVSVADTVYNPNPMNMPAAFAPLQAKQGAQKDPLWYLHSLPPANSAQLPSDLKGPAKDLPLLSSSQLTASAASADNKPSQITVESRNVFADLKDAVRTLPRWLLITLGVFLSGMGLFMLVGGLVLLRILFSQSRLNAFGNAQPAFAVMPAGFAHGAAMPMAGPGPMMPPGVPYVPTNVPVASVPSTMPSELAGKTAYATAPEPVAQPKLAFEDTASVNSLDYLKASPERVSQAVHNATLLKFPAHRARGGSRPSLTIRQASLKR